MHQCSVAVASVLVQHHCPITPLVSPHPNLLLLPGFAASNITLSAFRGAQHAVQHRKVLAHGACRPGELPQCSPRTAFPQHVQAQALPCLMQPSRKATCVSILPPVATLPPVASSNPADEDEHIYCNAVANSSSHESLVVTHELTSTTACHEFRMWLPQCSNSTDHITPA